MVKSHIGYVLGKHGMRPSQKAKTKIGKNIGTSDLTESRIPKGLNGLTSVWQSAERLIDRAKRIKAAVKELHKALHA
jgi:hypothetical protein